MRVLLHDRHLSLTDTRRTSTASRLPGARWDAHYREYQVPLSYPAVERLTAEHPEAEYSEQAQEACNQTRWKERRRQEAQRGVRGFGSLRPYQAKAAHWLCLSEEALLLDASQADRVTKTAAAIRGLRLDSVLVVCASDAATLWQDALSSAGLLVRPPGCDGHTPASDSRSGVAAVWLVTWAGLARKCGGKPGHLDRTKWDALVLDDADWLATHPSAAAVCHRLGLLARRRWLLTGVQVADTPSHVWPLLQVADGRTWADREAFYERYGGQQWNSRTRSEWEYLTRGLIFAQAPGPRT